MFVTVTLPASQYNIRTYVDIQLETNDISNKLRTYNHIMCNKSNIVIILIIYTYQYQWYSRATYESDTDSELTFVIVFQ